MERYFILVVEELKKCPKIDKLLEDFKLVASYQQLITKYPRNENFAEVPSITGTIDWALCVLNTQTLFKGSGAAQLQELVSTSFVADIPSESWENNSFTYLNYCAIDIIVMCEQCPDFWKNFTSCNNIKVYRELENAIFSHQLYWRGCLRIQDPQNSSHFVELDNAELGYCFDELDVLVNQIRKEISPLVPKQKKIFCPYLEVVGAFNSNKVPYIFYTSTSLRLTVHSESFNKSINPQISLLLRLDYTVQEMDHWEKGVGTQSTFFLSHFRDGRLHLTALKNADELQGLANKFVRLQTNGISEIALQQVELCEPEDELEPLRIDRLEKDVRLYQLKALKRWIGQNGHIDLPTMEKLLREVAATVAKRNRTLYIARDLAQKRNQCDYTEADYLKWKLEKKNTSNEMDRAATMSNSLPQPNGRLVTVDVNQMLRCLNKKNLVRSPRKARLEPCAPSGLRPNCDLETARHTAWPQSSDLKFHGINYNLSLEDEKAEKQRAEYQDKWVPADVATSSWCNPWSINSSSSFQLSARGNHSIPSAPSVVPSSSAIPEARTPKKSQQAMRDLAQLRKSPRLLAKTDAAGASAETSRTTRRSPSKKNSASAPIPKESFKQQLKAVIIRVLGDQKITPKDPIFRTCANKLSVICMALLKDSKDSVTPRQMFQVAKSQAKQVLQFVKP